MSEYRIDVNTYWAPWEHEVCQLCFNDNPNAIWLVKVYCFKPQSLRHINSDTIHVVIDHERMAMVSVRRVSTGLWRIVRFRLCSKGDNCGRKWRCWFPHSQQEVDMWNIKSRLIKGKSSRSCRQLVSQLCQASMKSQSPSEVCCRCYNENPKALWLTWLKCINTKEHTNEETVTVIVGRDERSGILSSYRERKLVKVRALPTNFTQFEQVKRCVSRCTNCLCQCAHSEEELLYWKWQVARKVIFAKYSDFLRLNNQYEYPIEDSRTITNVIRQNLSESNYHSKYHKLIYLEEIESSRKIIAECDKKDVTVRIEWSHEDSKYIGYLMNISYTAIDHASYNRAEVVITFQNGPQPYTTNVLDTPDYDRDALVLRTCNIGTRQPSLTVYEYKQSSVHFDIDHHVYHHQHKAIENADESTLAKLFPHHLRQSRSQVSNSLRENLGGFTLDKQYQSVALKKVFSCSSAAPFLLLGPFGTGKTYLLSAAVVKLVKSGGNKVLVCTHRNRGADGMYRVLQRNRMIRADQSVARMVGSVDAAEKLRLPGASIVTPDYREASKYTALVTTFGAAGKLVELVRQGRMCFTHILIDEGAQCPEPEALGALMLADKDTKVIIVGDNKQVGPQVRVQSDAARDNGLGQSILERLYSHYKGHHSLTESHTSTLLTNYRCHPTILMLASSLFYECTLLSETKRETHPKAPYPLVFACTSLKQENFRNCLPENEEEAKLLISKLVEFIETWPKPPEEPIGVLASTKQQVASLRKHWQSYRRTRQTLWNPRVKVAILPTYNIQGEEFSAIFLSTTEPTDSRGAPIDRFKSICNEYVFNTVITRPQSLIFVVGNPFLLLQMGSHFETNCWMEYIRRCIQCQSFIPPTIHLPSEAQHLPNIVGQVCEKVLLSETIQEAEEQELNSEEVDDIVERYISDLNERHEYQLAAKLVQSPSGDVSWVTEGSSPPRTRKGIVWCQLECKDFHNAIAKPLDSESNQEDIKLVTTGVMGRRGTFHGGVVKIDTLRKCVLFDEETENALTNTHFGASFPCRVDPKNPILFFPLDRRYPKFVNLPMLLVKDRNGVVCFDPKTINSTPKVSNFIPLEVAAKTLFMVKFLGWQSRYPYPLGIIVAALPPGNSPYTGELVLRISNNIPLNDCVGPPLVEAQGGSDTACSHTYDGAFTVDPEGSPDHDDALSCKLINKRDEGDVYQIGVHIANVQHYVHKDSVLDKEARKRGCAVYRSPKKCISFMLPEQLIRHKLSISEGKQVRTISVVAQYLIGKDNSVKELQGSVNFEDSMVDCSLELTYEQAYMILCTELKFRNNEILEEKIKRYNQNHKLCIQDQLSTLWKIAMFNRERRLGKQAAHSMPLDEPEKEKCPESHVVVEELMIWANCQVAKQLLQVFPDRTILKVQEKPQEEEKAKLQQEHGACLATSLGLCGYVPPNTPPVEEVHILQSTFQKIKDYLGRALIRNALHYVQFELLHPQIAVATVGVRRCEASSGSRYVVSTADRKDYSHCALRLTQYTHFTSPIRRYIDIVIQRLLHAVIHGKPCPYSRKELEEICLDVEEATKNCKMYNKGVKRLDLATDLHGISQEFVAFVQQVTEDAEIELTFADAELKVLYERERLVVFKHLNALSIPPTHQRELSPQESSLNASLSPEPPPDDTVVWQVKVASFKGTLTNFFANPEIQIIASKADPEDKNRCAEMSLFIPDGNIVSEKSSVTEHKLNARIIQCTCIVPQRLWSQIQNVITNLDLSKLRDQQADTIADKLLNEFGRQVQPQSYTPDPPTITSAPCPLLIYKLHRPLKMSEVVKVQLAVSALNHVPSPSLQLIEVGPELRICVQHNSNPAECFTDRLVDDASKREYGSLEEYFRCWEQVLLSEAVNESILESELLIVKDVTLKWPKLEHECDAFGQVTYKLNIPEGKKECGVKMELPKDFLKMSYEFFKFTMGDLLCIRYNVNRGNSTFGFTLHMVIHHSEIEGTAHVKDKATFFLKFVGNTSNHISPEVAQLLQEQTSGVTMQCEVQLLPLTLPFRRIYSCLHDLRLEDGVSQTARKIALGKAGRRNIFGRSQSIMNILKQREMSLATSLWPLLDQYDRGSRVPKKLNRFQKEALDIATFDSFTLIQGPPGTGKTVTGAHLAYVLTKKLRQERSSSTSTRLSSGSVNIEEQKPCVMYCGPSNQAVNVVLEILTHVKDELKILRVFSKTIEQEQYPGPKLHDQVFWKYSNSSASDRKCEPQHKPFALHELVRKANPRIAEMDIEFKQLHEQKKVASQAKRQEYYHLISAEEKHMLRENVDIILCTCNEASSARLRRTVKPIYCIVDECAMSTEPECMVPIQRAEHVVLIGDHQQLRPVIKNHVAEVKGLGTSLFERYVMEREDGQQLQKPHVLKLQYRMHRELCKLPSKLFYKDELETDESVNQRREPEAHLKFWPQGKDKPFVFVNIEGEEGREHTGRRGKAKVGLESKFNKDEAKKIARIASVLVTQHRVDPKQIAALTPYLAQKEEIKRYLKAAHCLSDIQVKTITESQGSEYGIVLLSTVRSKPVCDIKTIHEDNDGRKNADIGWLMKNIGFVADSHQICVGITRCKYGLVIVGNKALLSYDETWRQIIQHYERNHCVKNAYNFP